LYARARLNGQRRLRLGVLAGARRPLELGQQLAADLTPSGVLEVADVE
jgi:hypothetical protein